MTTRIRGAALALATIPSSLVLAAPQAALPTEPEAVRFLVQASFGPSAADIAAVTSLGYEAWIEAEIAKAPELHRPYLDDLVTQGVDPYQAHRFEAWWLNAVRGDAQLGGRMTWALSQILVVSDRGAGLNAEAFICAEYYDTLSRHALGNYRDLLIDVAKSPAMAIYLGMLQNEPADPLNNIRPDENFARELMQLFTIGLVQLAPDGTALLDVLGNPVPTYDQTVVEELARVFTGWNYAGAATWQSNLKNYLPLENWPSYHDTGAKTIVDGIVVPAGQTGQQDLEDAIDALFGHPNLGPFLGRQLIQRLVTSNPSPDYVARVAAVFADDGLGVRGNLAAVARAILTDTEARRGHLSNPQSFGKLKEPMLRLTHLWRLFEAEPVSGAFQAWGLDEAFGQAALRAPSVFNFYSPSHQPAGVLQSAQLFAPEFQITNHITVTSTANRLYHQTFENWIGNPNPQFWQTEINLDGWQPLAANPDQLIDRIDTLLLADSMSPAMRQTLLNHVAATALDDDGTQRVLEALFLTVTSPQFAVQK